MKRVAIYSRKSKETDKGQSTKIQIKMCQEYFERSEPCEFEIFEDEGFSGGNTNRPAFQLMMNRVKSKEFDVVVVYKVDRIGRNISDFFKVYDTLVKYNTELVSITEGFDPRTPSGKMMMLMLAGFADMEREHIKQRVRDNMLELAKQGKWSGGNAPVGYRSNRVIENGKKCSYLQIKDEEIQIVKDIYDLYLEGYSTRKIATKINSMYSLSTSQKRICNILYSPIYVESTQSTHDYLRFNGYEVVGDFNGNGYLTYQKTKVLPNGSKILNKDAKTIAAVSKHKPIISADKWINVQNLLKKSTLEPKPRISSYTFLAHLIRCGYCGANMQVYSEERLNQDRYRFFRKTCTCSHGPKKFTRGSRISVPKAEQYVMLLLNKYTDIEILKQYFSNTKDENNIDTQIKKIQKEINKLNKIIDGLLNKLALASAATEELFNNKIENTAKEKQKLQEDLLVLEKKKTFIDNTDENINILHNTIKDFTTKFDLLSIEEKQHYIKNIIDHIEWRGLEKDFAIKFIEV